MSSSTSGVVAALLALTVLGCASTRTDIANDSASESPDADLAKLIPDVEVPSDVRIRVTDEGPVFTDAQGMTLYWTTLDSQKPGGSHCNDTYPPPAAADHPTLHVYYEVYKDKAPPCTAQWPPLLVSPGAKGAEKWSIVTRDDGTKQWAYNGYPVYRSYKDLRPGDVNGVVNNREGASDSGLSLPGLQYHWYLAAAPVALPPGVTTITRNDVGMIATTPKGTLYTLRPQLLASLSAPKRRDNCTYDCPTAWRPFAAGATAQPIGHWTVGDSPDGGRQWLFKGKPVYTYAGDEFAEHMNGIAGGDPVTLVPPPPPPPGFERRFVGIGEVFTNSEGKTLYTFYCNLRAPGSTQATSEKFSCSNWSDDVTIREQFCAAPDRCGERWVPVRAPDDEQPRAGTWSVAVIPDPKYPLRWVPADHPSANTPGAIKVWTHRGRPIYTFTEDKFPLEFRGHHIFHNSGIRWAALAAGMTERQ